MDIKNFKEASDPFAVEQGKDHSKIHVRVQQRNGRKCITTIEGLADDLDLSKILRALKKTFKCNGNVHLDPELGEIAQLSGDQRTNVRDFFVDQEVCREDQIVIHGG
jgi:translation initiation factor 1